MSATYNHRFRIYPLTRHGDRALKALARAAGAEYRRAIFPETVAMFLWMRLQSRLVCEAIERDRAENARNPFARELLAMIPPFEEKP